LLQKIEIIIFYRKHVTFKQSVLLNLHFKIGLFTFHYGLSLSVMLLHKSSNLCEKMMFSYQNRLHNPLRGPSLHRANLTFKL